MKTLIKIFLLVFAFSNCGKKEEKISYSLETAQIVSHVTSGTVPSGTEIRVRFVEPIVNKSETGKELKKSVFNFNPSIGGKTFWKDERTLIFKPETPLPFYKKYSGELDLQNFFPENKKLEPLKFNFEIAGREIETVTTDFRPEQVNNPKFLLYEATISFTENTDFQAVKNSVSFYEGEKKLLLNWLEASDSLKFSFVTEKIERTNTEKTLRLEVEKDKLEISQDFEKNFVLPSLKDLKILRIHSEIQQKQPVIRIDFSDELDVRQDLEGLIFIEQLPEVRLKKTGKSVFVTGNLLKFGNIYNLIVNQGVRSRFGTVLLQPNREKVYFEDLKPQVIFSGDGVFLPTANEQKINFQTVNIDKVRLVVKKVFESNLGQFLQEDSFNGEKNRKNDVWIERIGVEVANCVLELGAVRNKWLQSSLDLKKILKKGEKGLFFITLSFTKKDILYGLPDDPRLKENEREPGEEGYYYYDYPYSDAYYYWNANACKPVILSDIGLIYKKAGNQHTIYATNIEDASELGGVKITLRSKQNQILAETKTDSDGKAVFEDVSEEIFYVEGEKNDQRSIVLPREMSWNLSNFDTGGTIASGSEVQAFIYTERGVYRPGDEINLSVIARNEKNTFPLSHPVTLRIFNPKNQLVHEQTQQLATDGFYNFTFKTNTEDLTGNWNAEVKIGSKIFTHKIKVETVVPNKLKIKIESDKPEIGAKDKSFELKISANYLFGNPASGLETAVELYFVSEPKTFPKFPAYSFTNEAIDFYTSSLYSKDLKLSTEGTIKILSELPFLANSPSALRCDVLATVFDKGGISNQKMISFPVSPYNFYVGLKKPEETYAETGSTLETQVVLLNSQGETVSGKPLKYRIYKNTSFWWWEFDNHNEYKLRFKTHLNTELVEEGNLLSQNQPVFVEFTPESNGEYFLEVENETVNGHTAGLFFEVFPFGESSAAPKDAGILTLKSDKESYKVGEQAMITFPTPKEGKLLFTLEKGTKIMQSYWEDLDGELQRKIKIPITKKMLPNAYVTVAIIQPHKQTLNDRPLRLYGVIPIKIEDSETRQEIEIKMPETLAANKPFEVQIQTQSKKQTQFTIAIVDEGLLDLTAFKTPDPQKNFFQKQSLEVFSYDLFGNVVGANKGDIFKTFAIGGSAEEDYRTSQLASRKNKRFNTVSIFKGPLQTNKQGFAKLNFEMPDYVGSVRVMVVSAKENSYGNVEKTVPVKTDLMIVPSFPRVLGAGDKISVPVTIFSMNENLKNITVSAEIEGTAKISGSKQKELFFEKAGEQDVYFEILADKSVGTAKIKILAKSGNFTVQNTTELEVCAASPRIFESETKECLPNTKSVFTITNKGIEGSNFAKLTLETRPNLNFEHRLSWLLAYPYGCVEQTVSAAFPQLSLKNFFEKTQKEADKNINAAITKLRKFQLASGAFAYWQGESEPSVWGTVYAGHFLIEAKKLGYNVPEDLLNAFLRYEKKEASSVRNNLLTRVYTVYLLSLAGKPEFGAMNLLKENSLWEMQDVEKWLLAGSYKLAGAENVSQEILKKATTKVEKSSSEIPTFGSVLRDKAIILEMLTLFGKFEKANELAKEISSVLTGKEWFSTQTVGYCLLSLGNFLEKNEGKGTKTLSGYVLLPNGKKIEFQNQKRVELELKEGFGKNLELFLNEQTSVHRAFATLDWNGIPLKSEIKNESKNLKLTVSWIDETGKIFDPTKLKQGTSFYGLFKIEKNSQDYEINELVLVQLFPACWEIQNQRIAYNSSPSWNYYLELTEPDYQDIRDDRVLFFFDFPLKKKEIYFLVKLNAASVGEFTLPPTVVEAMYNLNYKATSSGKKVSVTR